MGSCETCARTDEPTASEMSSRLAEISPQDLQPDTCPLYAPDTGFSPEQALLSGLVLG